jgi:hypothetical protein
MYVFMLIGAINLSFKKNMYMNTRINEIKHFPTYLDLRPQIINRSKGSDNFMYHMHSLL